jgi:hypothetical protein
MVLGEHALDLDSDFSNLENCDETQDSPGTEFSFRDLDNTIRRIVNKSEKSPLQPIDLDCDIARDCVPVENYTEDGDHYHVFGSPDSFAEMMKELDKPIPWYENLYNAIVYRFPWRTKLEKDNLISFFERGQKGYAHSDVWCFYEYLAEVISEGTKELKGTVHGYPPSLSQEEWDVILGKISEGFACFSEENPYEDFSEEKQAKIDEAFDLLKKYFVYMWD